MSGLSTPKSRNRHSRLFSDFDLQQSPIKQNFSNVSTPTSPRFKHKQLQSSGLHSRNNLIVSSSSSNSVNTNIKVICRFRPQNQLEIENNNPSIVEFLNDETVSINGKDYTNTFTFDKVFDHNSSQVDIYHYSIHQTLEDYFNGYNGTILAYGQTGSGKSYTMFGPSLSDEASCGLIPRITNQIFNHIKNGSPDIEYTVGVSYMEIYMEQIKDLLDTSETPSASHNYTIHEDKDNGVYVKGLNQIYVSSSNELLQVLKQGTKIRATSSTNMNFESSRSHAIFQIKLSQKNLLNGTIKKSNLFLVDLAGSEKVIKTGAQGHNLEEAKKINSSLLALGLVINSLTDNKSSHIPYRDSKLTRILQESLGGNSRTTLIINCSPALENEPETLSTLRFGSRAKSIRNVVHINTESSVHQLKLRNSNLEKQNLQQADYIKTLEYELLQWRNNETPGPNNKTFSPGLSISTSLANSIGPSLSSPTLSSTPMLSSNNHLKNILSSPRTPSKIPLPPTNDTSSNRLNEEINRRDKKISELESVILSMKMENVKNSHQDELKLYKLENALHKLNDKLNDVELINVNLRKHLLISEKIIESRDHKIGKLKNALKDQHHQVRKESVRFENKLDLVKEKLENQKLEKQQQQQQTTFIEEGVETSFHQNDSLSKFLTDNNITEQVLTVNSNLENINTPSPKPKPNGLLISTTPIPKSRPNSVISSPLSPSPKIGLNLRIVKPLRGGGGPPGTSTNGNNSPLL